MARLTLTNDRGLHLLVLETERTAGYGDYDEVSHDSLWLAVHWKRRFPVRNYKSFPNGDFVASAGTLIYKKKIGEEALIQLYTDFNGDVHQIRESALGSYLIGGHFKDVRSALYEETNSPFSKSIRLRHNKKSQNRLQRL